MANSVKTLALLAGGAVCSLLVTLPAPSALALTLKDGAAQSGSSGSRSPFALTLSTDPYNFSGQGFSQLTTIDQILVTLTFQDGDTAAGNFDFNNLFLALDGINTGIALNGFFNNQTNTQTLSGAPTNSNSILTNLKLDGRLAGTIIDTDADNDGRLIPGGFTTTLEIRGQVVPFEISPGLGSVVIGAWGAIAYFKSKGQKGKFSGGKLSKN